MVGRHLEHVVIALDSLRGVGPFAVPRQPFGRHDFIWYRAPIGRQQVRKFLRRLFDRSEFHGDVKPIQDPGQRSPGAVDRFFKFAGAVGDDRDILIWRRALLRKKMVKPGRCRRDFPMTYPNTLQRPS